MTEVQGGSCEPCKRKKCKCDRQVPHCSQCSVTPSLCKYEEGNRRGIPGGYLNSLEQRLHETEVALYGALTEIRRLNSQYGQANVNQSSGPDVSRLANSSKPLRLQEWKHLPLKTTEDTEIWWQAFSKYPLNNDNRSNHQPNSPTQDFEATSHAPISAQQQPGREQDYSSFGATVNYPHAESTHTLSPGQSSFGASDTSYHQEVSVGGPTMAPYSLPTQAPASIQFEDAAFTGLDILSHNACIRAEDARTNSATWDRMAPSNMQSRALNQGAPQTAHSSGSGSGILQLQQATWPVSHSPVNSVEETENEEDDELKKAQELSSLMRSTYY